MHLDMIIIIRAGLSVLWSSNIYTSSYVNLIFIIYLLQVGKAIKYQNSCFNSLFCSGWILSSIFGSQVFFQTLIKVHAPGGSYRIQKMNKVPKKDKKKVLDLRLDKTKITWAIGPPTQPKKTRFILRLLLF